MCAKHIRRFILLATLVGVPGMALAEAGQAADAQKQSAGQKGASGAASEGKAGASGTDGP